MEKQEKVNAAVAWIALIISVIALWVGIVAFNRSGQNLFPTIGEETQEAADEVAETTGEVAETTEEVAETADQIAARVEAEAVLLKVKGDVAEDEISEETKQQLQEVRTNLREAYADADDEVKQQYEQIDEDLETLETQLEGETAEALLTVENLLERMRRDVLTDED